MATARLSVLLVGLALLVLLSAHESSATFRCYVCNSNADRNCVDNFYSLIQTCPQRKLRGQLRAAIGCRKIRQNIEGELSTVRECAYMGDNDTKTHKGSQAISIDYYQCSDKNGCNGGSRTAVTLSAVAALLALPLLGR